jgi:Protein of unknown function (DUF3515)
VAAAATLLVWGVAACSGGATDASSTQDLPADAPVPLDVPPGKAAPACRELLARLPAAVADQGRRDVSPADAPGAAWGSPPITLVCGVDEPAGFDDVASCLTVNGVDWYIPPDQLEAEGDLTMTTVYRKVAVRVHLPAEYFPPATTLADLARPVRQSIPATDACF